MIKNYINSCNINFTLKCIKNYGMLLERMIDEPNKNYKQFANFYKNTVSLQHWCIKYKLYDINIPKNELFSTILNTNQITKKNIANFIYKKIFHYNQYDITDSYLENEKLRIETLTHMRFMAYFNLTPEEKIQIDKLSSIEEKNKILDSFYKKNEILDSFYKKNEILEDTKDDKDQDYPDEEYNSIIE